MSNPVLLLLLLLSHFSHVWLFENLWTVSCLALLSVGSSRQEFWSSLPCLLPGGLPHRGVNPASFTSPKLAGRFFTSAIWEALLRNFSMPSPVLKTYKHYLIYVLKTTLCAYYYYSPNEKTEVWRGLIFKPSVLVLIRAHFLFPWVGLEEKKWTFTRKNSKA